VKGPCLEHPCSEQTTSPALDTSRYSHVDGRVHRHRRPISGRRTLILNTLRPSLNTLCITRRGGGEMLLRSALTIDLPWRSADPRGYLEFG
jgi:hypothetical protein